MSAAAIATISIPSQPRIAVDVAGHGPLVLLLHGLGGSRAGWRDVLPALAQGGFRVAAWDARGHGDSDDFEGPLRFADLRSDILRVLDVLGAPRAHLVGQSMGGLTALDFYLRHPQRVASLTLSGFAGESLRQTMTDAELQEWLALRRQPLMAGKTLGDIAPTVARNILSGAASPELQARVAAGVSANRRAVYLKAVDALAQYDERLDPAVIRVPTLVLVGQEDRVVPPETARAAACRIRGARFEVVAHAGHLIYVERPRTFSDLVHAFLRTHPSHRRWPGGR